MIYIIYQDVPNNIDDSIYIETLGYCYTEKEAKKVATELRKQRHPKQALMPYTRVYPGRVYFKEIHELKAKVREK